MNRRSTRCYYIWLGGNIISWTSKKQNVVAQSSAEAQYRALASLTSKPIWVKQFSPIIRFL